MLPDNFNSFEFLQDLIKKVLTKEIKKEFEDIETDELDIASPRNALRTACLPDDNDTASMLLLRLFFYYFTMRKAQDLFPVIAGIPLDEYQQKITSKPQITLFFKENISEVDQDFTPLESRVSLRLVDETHLTITEAKLKSIATKIKTSFGGSTPFSFKRGRYCCHYHDKEKGYKFQLYVFAKTEAKDVIEKVLDLVNEIPQWEYFTSSENENVSSAYPILPPQSTIVGELRRLPRKRPVGTVRFTHATAEVYGVPRPILLYGGTTTFRKALVY